MVWLYKGEEITEDTIGDAAAFVYLITNNVTGKKYIGKKLFTASKIRQVKGKKKRSRVPSNWQSYFGSNEELNNDVVQYGEEKFTREILHLCKNKADATYLEAKEQFTRSVLESNE